MQIPLFVPAGTLVIVYLVILISGIHRKRKKRGSPFASDLLRSPGQSLLARIDGFNEEVQVCALVLILYPIMVFAMHVVQTYFMKIPESETRVAVSAAGVLVVISYFLLKLLRLLSKRRIFRLGYQGEVAVGQELNQYMSDGYKVYHDFPADNFNIDHIVVGPSGVLAVETKTRSTGTTKDRRADAVVTYDGRMLHFPKGSDHNTIDQAKRQAEWLSAWLTSAVGEPVDVRAIVAIPGWYVRRTSPDGISVVNPRQFDSLFKHIQPRPLPDKLFQQIAHQIEQKCRDVVPAMPDES